MEYSRLVDMLDPWCVRPAPRRWPVVGLPVEDPHALWARLSAWAPDGMLPPLGGALPGSDGDGRGGPGDPIPMVGLSASVSLERLGPFSDGSRQDELEVRFRFGSFDSLRLLVENGRDSLFRIVHMTRFAESGYEGHARMSAPVSADEFASILWEAVPEDVRTRVSSPETAGPSPDEAG